MKDSKNIKVNGENDDFDIPSIPEPPKAKNRVTVNSPGLSTSLLKRIKDLEQKDVKVVLVNCERCKEIIPVAIPIGIVRNSEIPVVPVSYIHYNHTKTDKHCITLYLDHDFDIRRQRISEVVFSSEDTIK